jgi:SAM-dependent methyltransferase
MNSGKNRWDLFLISAIALFLELAVIRWLSTEIRIFAYFKNLPLMAAFLGFGIGFWLSDRAQRLLPWFPRLMLLLVVLIAGASGLGITHVIFVDPRKYFILGTGFGDHAVDSVPSLLATLKALCVIVFVFFLVMATFATLASKIGDLLNRSRPLTAYSINVAGSLIGIVGFSLVSFLQWPPVVWLVAAFVPLLYFYREHRRPALVYFSAAVAFALAVQLRSPAIWSPYYRVEVRYASTAKAPNELHLYVNYDGFQVIENLAPEYLRQFPVEQQRTFNRHYNLPYQLSRSPAESVLILGGGAGNDAAAALRNGATRVDVVEIDPVIAQLGRRLHPENPYSSSRVRLFVDDARSFLQRCASSYDLIVFATLDSQTVFSSLSSLRLDNFVFTQESLESAKRLLRPGGGIALNFFNIKPWLSQRHFNTLASVMGQSPLTYSSAQNQETLFLAGERFDPARPLGTTDYEPVSPQFSLATVEATHDDWPFLFLERRSLPVHYLLPLGIILALALLALNQAGVRLRDIDGHLFFMGSAFLLIETKAVTTLALTFGSTWVVNSIVIAAILIMILLANLLAEKVHLPGYTFLYVLLVATLVFNFLFSFDLLNRFSWTARLVTSSCIIALPLFFASLIFARSFAGVTSPGFALASNLLGGLLGGFLEYLDMWTGLRWLNIVALVLYLVSLVLLQKPLSKPVATTVAAGVDA